MVEFLKNHDGEIFTVSKEGINLPEIPRAGHHFLIAKELADEIKKDLAQLQYQFPQSLGANKNLWFEAAKGNIHLIFIFGKEKTLARAA